MPSATSAFEEQKSPKTSPRTASRRQAFKKATSAELTNPALGDIEIMDEEPVQIDIANDRIKFVGQLFETAAAIIERPSIDTAL